MATEVNTYDPKQVTGIFGGAIANGYAPDTWIEVTRQNDMWSDVVGCDGTVARAKTNDKRGTVVVTLLETSPFNDVLSAYYQADEKTSAGTFPFMLRDANGRTLCTALTAWITKPADVSYGSGVGTRAWTIHTGALDMTVGGN